MDKELEMSYTINNETCYTININMPLDEYTWLIKDIFTHLKENSNNNKLKIYIDGEMDSNQTDFEKKSNSCKIGVLASSEKIGYSLLLFLRMIIDNNMNLLIWIFEDKPNINIDMATVMKTVEKYETNYTDVYEPGQSITRTLYKQCIPIHINKNIDEIDIWTLAKIETEIMDKLEYHEIQ